MNQHIINIGDNVLCDHCNEDYTTSHEHGGVFIGSYAICPRYAPAAMRSAEKHGELVDAVCPASMSFKDWVLALRGGDNTIRISAMDACERCGTDPKDAYESLCYDCQMQSAAEDNEA
jgi:hypothetical protein